MVEGLAANDRAHRVAKGVCKTFGSAKVVKGVAARYGASNNNLRPALNNVAAVFFYNAGTMVDPGAVEDVAKHDWDAGVAVAVVASNWVIGVNTEEAANDGGAEAVARATAKYGATGVDIGVAANNAAARCS